MFFDLNATNALRHPTFLRWTIGLSMGTMGLWMQRLTTGWLIWELTHSTFWVGLNVVMHLAPAGLFGPFVGVLVEQWNIKRTIVISQSLNAGVYGLLMLAALMGIENPLVYVGLTLCTGLINIPWQPARLVFLTLLVPKHALSSAIAYNAVTFNAMRILGPAVAGLLISISSVTVTFAVAFGLYACFVVSTMTLQASPRTFRPQTEPYLERLIQGLRYSLNHRMISLALLTVLGNAVIVRTAQEILPAINGQLLQGDSDTLALLTTTSGIGAIISSLLVAWLSASQNIRWSMLMQGGLFLGVLCTILIGFTSHLWVMVGLILLMSTAATLTGVSTQSLLQLSVSEAYRARVMSLWGAMAFGTIALGSLVAGALGDWFSLSIALWSLGTIGLLISILVRGLEHRRVGEAEHEV